MASFLDRLLRRDPDALPHTVRVDRALALLDEGGLLVDVRETAEWKSGHAPRARHIPLGKLANEARRLPKDATIIVVCASGSRSRSGASQLRSVGYQATSLSGGMAAWQASGGPVTSR